MEHLWLPENLSTYGEDVDRLFYLILVITGIAFLATQTALVLFLVRYRSRPGRQAFYTHGSHAIEIMWSVVPGLVLLFLALVQQSTWNHIKRDLPSEEEAFRVQLRAKQFEWEFAYAGPDGVFGTEDDVYTINELHVPFGRPVIIHARSQDVLHSFFQPESRVKQDVVPGMNIPIWFEPTRTGRWEIACAELCGLGHYRMRGFYYVHEEEEFEEWQRRQLEDYGPWRGAMAWAWKWNEPIPVRRQDGGGSGG